MEFRKFTSGLNSYGLSEKPDPDDAQEQNV